jgi:cytochrome P450
MLLVIAARDTTGCLISAAVWVMSRHPEAQAKLRREVDERLGKRQPGFKDLQNLNYLNWFIKETLRLYPPGPFNTREATRDTFLPRGGGPDGSAPIFVPKGQEVVFHIWSMHRRQDLWGEDAEHFRPERWDEEKPSNKFMPFSAGPRVCLGEFRRNHSTPLQSTTILARITVLIKPIGQQFALLEASYVLVRLLQEYADVEAVDPELPWTEKLSITASIFQGVNIKLTRNKPV